MDLLPAIDILDGKAVRLAKGDYKQVTVYHENPFEQALAFEADGASWIHVVDLDGAKTGIPQNISRIEQIVSKTSLRVETGGGIRSIETIERLAQAGAKRIVLGTSLVSDPEFAQEAIETYGDLLAAGIDAKSGEVAVSGWREGSGLSARDLVVSMADLGYRHLVYTDIARDGMQTGIDEQVYAKMAELFGNPVIASGGLAGIDDLVRLGDVADSIEGVIAGRAIYEGSLTVKEGIALCKQFC